MKKNKHDHKGTKALKLTIFFTLMLAPFMAVLFKCCYVTFNKNAKDSYYGETINQVEYNNLNNANDLVVNEKYNINIPTIPTGINSTTGTFTIRNISNFKTSYTSSIDVTTITSFYIGYNTASQYNVLTFTRSNSNNLYINLQQYYVSFDFYLENITTYNNLDNYISYFSTMNYNNYSYLDNAFYYAIDEAMDSQYFAWARTSALYTATSGLTNGLGINTQAIPTLLVYWLILTTIYIIFDIVIESFTYLTHMITSRFE